MVKACQVVVRVRACQSQYSRVHRALSPNVVQHNQPACPPVVAQFEDSPETAHDWLQSTWQTKSGVFCTKNIVGCQMCYLPVDCRGSVSSQSGLSWRILGGQILQSCEGWRIPLDDLCPGCLSVSPSGKQNQSTQLPLQLLMILLGGMADWGKSCISLCLECSISNCPKHSNFHCFCLNCWQAEVVHFWKEIGLQKIFLKPGSKDSQIIGIISPSKLLDMTKDAFFTWVVSLRILDAQEVQDPSQRLDGWVWLS